MRPDVTLAWPPLPADRYAREAALARRHAATYMLRGLADDLAEAFEDCRGLTAFSLAVTFPDTAPAAALGLPPSRWSAEVAVVLPHTTGATLARWLHWCADRVLADGSLRWPDLLVYLRDPAAEPRPRFQEPPLGGRGLHSGPPGLGVKGGA